MIVTIHDGNQFMHATIPLLSILLYVSIYASGCVSSSSSSAIFRLKDAPAENLVKAIDQGGDAFLSTSSFLLKASQIDKYKYERVLVSFFQTNIPSWNTSQLLRAVKLYQHTPKRFGFLVFSNLQKAPHKQAYSFAWMVLGGMDQSIAAEFADSALSQALLEGHIEKHFVIEMAQAVKKWRLSSVYSVVHMALLKTGESEFVEAMTTLSPQKASDDLLSYLALAPDSDLRQLFLDSIDATSALLSLEHLAQYPPNFGHAHLRKLFSYAGSRQLALQDAALQVIDKLTPTQPMIVAYELSRTEKWVQLAFIERVRRDVTPNRKLLLQNLATLTADENIRDEIALLDF
ncbi:MAG: hypothetical protein OXC44_03695 [Proteobacteria bacterium]|nr:hypothetical protein [Pseudomonadota bacterium]